MITANLEEMEFDINMEKEKYEEMEEIMNQVIGKRETDDALAIIKSYGVNIIKGGEQKEDKVIYTTTRRVFILCNMWFIMGILITSIVTGVLK